jgi:hypothetical protein
MSNTKRTSITTTINRDLNNVEYRKPYAGITLKPLIIK